MIAMIQMPNIVPRKINWVIIRRDRDRFDVFASYKNKHDIYRLMLVEKWF